MKRLISVLSLLAAVASLNAFACDEGGCPSSYAGVHLGDIVYVVGRDDRMATVVGIQSGGKFVLRFGDGVGGGWERSDLAVTTGCTGDICVGQKVYDVGRDYKLATVVGRQTNGKFVLNFEDGAGSGWERSDLAVTHGCQKGFCVGQRVFDVGRSSMEATVVGLQSDGKFVLEFADGVGGGWDSTDLVCDLGQ